MNKKAMGPVVATALLIVVAVVSLVGFQNWFGMYSSNIFSNTETQSSQTSSIPSIEGVVNGELYVKSSNNQNLSVEKILVNGNDCDISQNISGIEKISIEDCLEIYGDSNSEVTIITENEVITKQIYLDSKEFEELGKPTYTDTFISVWDTTQLTTGSSDDKTIALPLESDGDYEFYVDWGDGSNSSITSYNQAEVNHTYSLSGIYEVRITGKIKGFRFGYAGDRNKLLEIKAWGPLNVGNNNGYFYGCENLFYSGNDDLNLDGTTSLINMFANTNNFSGDLSNWDVSKVVTIGSMFYRSENFQGILNNWEFNSLSYGGHLFSQSKNFQGTLNNWNLGSSVSVSLQRIFSYSENFHGSLNNWDTKNVFSILNGFARTINFSSSLNDWDLSSANNIIYLFYESENFQGDLSNWKLTNCENFVEIFGYSENFQGDLSGWDLSSAKDLNFTFRGSKNFSADLSSWDVGSVENMFFTFAWVTNFSGNIDNWNTSSVINMQHAFHSANNLNSNIENWNVNSVNDMSYMFLTSNFNQDIGNWDVSRVTNMMGMFTSAERFNQDIGSWDVSQVENMNWMFAAATSFNQDLTDWSFDYMVSHDDFDADATAWQEEFKPSFPPPNP